MNHPSARLLFDECLPKPFFTRLVDFVKPKEGQAIEIEHLLNIAPSGTPDEVWIPRIRDGNWTVITADAGRQPNRKRGGKLPHLCMEFGITLICLSPVVHNRKAFDKTRTILSVWDQIVEIASDQSQRGYRYMLEPMRLDNPGVGRLVLKAKPQ